MISKVKKNSDVINAVESAVGERYTAIPFHAQYMEEGYSETWFKVSDDRFVHVDTFDGNIVIEYCDDISHRFLAEDGDTFYLGDYDGLEEMIRAIFAEIEEE